MELLWNCFGCDYYCLMDFRATFVGLAYGYATVMSSSIIVPMASHAVNNLVGGILWRYGSKPSGEQKWNCHLRLTFHGAPNIVSVTNWWIWASLCCSNAHYGVNMGDFIFPFLSNGRIHNFVTEKVTYCIKYM